MQKTRTRVISALLVFMMLLSLMPTVAFAAEGDVAQIGDTTYATLDEAVAAATSSEETEVTITVLESCTITNSITIPTGKTFTLTAAADAGITITDTGRHGMRPNGSLTMENITFITNGQIALNGTTSNGPFGREIIFRNVTLKMDGDMYQFNGDGYYCCAIFADSPALFVFDGCNVEIKNYPSTGAAIRWNGKNGDRGYGVEFINKTKFVSDGNYAGFIGTLDILIDDSEVQVLNSRGYGSNGTFYTIQNGSDVLFDGNTDWGISANELTMTTGSTLTATNNGRSGIWTRALNVDSTCTLTVERNGYDFGSNMSSFEQTGSFGSATGATSNAGITYWGKSGVTSTIEAGATVTIQNNAGSGISALQGICNLTIESGTITNNGLGNEESENPAIYGGGIFSIGTIVIGPDVDIYNNHASKAGDDIYFAPTNDTKSLTFGEVGEGWALDGDPDCTHDIDGWYDDSENARWEAHAANAADNHIIEFTGFTDGAATVTGLTALKAAHGLLPLDSEWETSKSKTATNLDDNYESDVTLSLPAADYERTIDVVFVIDDTHAGSGIFEEAVNGLLDDLAEKGNLDINVGIVAFDAVARDWLAVTSENAYVGLVSLKDANALAALKTAIGTQLAYTNNGEANPDGDYTEKVGATNTEWPLELTQEILKTGNGSEQHVIMFSDMYGYVYRGDLTIDGITYENVPLSKRLGNYKLGQLCISDPKYNNWTDVYANREEANDTTYDSFFRDSSWDAYWNIYTNVATNPNINNAPQNSVPQYVDGATFYYFTPFEKSSCLTYDRIQALLDVGIQVTIVNNDFDPGSSVIQGIKNEMLDDLADQGVTLIREQAASGETFNSTEMGKVSAALQNKLIQVVDAGSYVVDEIGSGTDDAGIEYNFDFIDDIDNLTLTVGDEELAKEELTDINVDHPGAASGYGFKKAGSDVYDFELYYYPTGRDGQSNECFVWEINVPVTKDQTVQLTYTVKLTDPQTASGTYGQFDADGSDEYTGLYTNNSATLYPVDSNGYKHVPEAFAKPTVSYTVGGSSSGGGGGNPSEPSIRPDEPDDLNTEDHYAYIIGYPIDYRTGEPTDDKSVWPVQPQGNITRAEVATIFFRMLTDDARAEYWSQTNDYNDVEPDDWFNNAVSTLTNMGIISGDPDGAFRPNDPITRAELTKVAVGFFDVTGDYEDGTFSDVDADSWYADFIDAAFDLGLVEGYPAGTIRPQAYITRAEAATMVNRTLGRVPDTDHLLPEDEMRVWPDNSDADAWYYAQIQEATNSHDYEWITSGGEEIENWTHKLNDRIWEQLEREWSDAYSAPGGEVVD